MSNNKTESANTEINSETEQEMLFRQVELK